MEFQTLSLDDLLLLLNCQLYLNMKFDYVFRFCLLLRIRNSDLYSRRKPLLSFEMKVGVAHESEGFTIRMFDESTKRERMVCVISSFIYKKNNSRLEEQIKWNV